MSFFDKDLLNTEYIQKHKRAYDEHKNTNPYRNYEVLLDSLNSIYEYNEAHANSFTKRIKSQQKEFKDCEAIFAEIIVYAYYLRLVNEGILKSLDIEEADYDLRIELADGSFHYLEIFSIKPNLEPPEREASEKLEDLPVGLEFPNHLKNKIRYDNEKKLLIWEGLMAEGEKDELLGLSKDEQYKKAIETFFQKCEPKVYDIKAHLQKPLSSVRQKLLNKIRKQKQLSQPRENFAVIEMNDPSIAGDFSILSSLSSGYKVMIDTKENKIIDAGFDWSNSIFDNEIVKNLKGVIYFSMGDYGRRKFVFNPNFKGEAPLKGKPYP